MGRPFYIWIPTAGFGYAHVENFKPFPLPPKEESKNLKDQPTNKKKPKNKNAQNKK